MIGQLTGTVGELLKDGLLLDVGGVGYLVHTTTSTLANTASSKTLVLQTHLVVREDSLTLYGFPTRHEVRFFGLLIGVSGIGPKTALAVMNLADVATLEGAISEGDTTYLTRVSGIGRKVAEKIVLELKDKFGGADTTGSPGRKEDTDVLQALEALGYGKHEAREALKQVPKDTRGTNERLKEVLKILGKG